MVMRKPLLFIPGPMQVPEHVREAADRPLISHRSSQMSSLLMKLEELSKPLFGTSGDVLFMASSGTGAMESAIANLTSPGDEIIVLVGGVFAARWSQIAEAYGLTVRAVDVDWRSGATAAEIEGALNQWPKAEVVFHTWSESSTGVLNEMAKIGERVRSQNKIFVADGVSGLGVSAMRMDDWSIDATVIGSQKGLMLPPGLGIVAVGPRAWEKQTRSKAPRFYWDWKKYLKTQPFTPATSMLFQLEASLDYIHSQGLPRIFERRLQVADRIRDLVRRSGMEIYALKPGNGITGVIPPQGFSIGALRGRLESDYGIQIGEGLGKIQDTTFRIGHVGHLTDEEVDYFIDSFKHCLD
jgi:serine---pyruvate transaminase